LRAHDGEYEPGDNSILWEWRRVGDLQFLNVQEEGKVEFWLKLKEEWEIPSLEGKEVIKNKIYLSQVREEFINKVNSKLVITQKGYINDEIFLSEGPLPPKVGQESYFTIMWQVKNYYNEVKNVKVKATLPKNVKLTGKIFPEEETEKFTFDSQSREIVWNVGDLKVAQGILSSAPNIAFQVVLTPDSAQIGQTPEIIGQAKTEGEDSWTKETLREATSNINTTLPDDPTITEEMGRVQ
jgi:hypothetical protein